MASGEGSCVSCWHWTASVIVWGSIIFFIIARAGGSQDMATPSFVILGIGVLTYLISAFCASTCRYLMNPTSGSDIYGYMQTMFYTPAHLVMHVQCYHNETRHHTERDSQGNTHTRTETVRVNTHSATERFYYVSWRDISGQFLLDTTGAQASQKLAFVKLHLSLHLEFSNDGTREDYERQREWFKSRNRMDVYQDYSECTEMDGFNEFNLVRVSDYQPTCFGVVWYILFTFLTLVEFYKMYVDRFCVLQRFNVNKVVSSRRDLNSGQYIVEYLPMMPCIVYLGQIRKYDAIPIMPTMVAPPAVGSIQVNVGMPGQMQMGMPGVQMTVSANTPLIS